MKSYVFCFSSKRCRVCNVAYKLTPAVRLVPWYYEKQGKSIMREAYIWRCAKCATEHIVRGEHVIKEGSDRLLLHVSERLNTSQMNPGYVLAAEGLDIDTIVLQSIMSHSSTLDVKGSLFYEYHHAMAEVGKSLLFLIISMVRFHDLTVSDRDVANIVAGDYDGICDLLYDDLYIAYTIKLCEREEPNRYRLQYREVLFALIYAIYSSKGYYKLFEYISKFIGKLPILLDCRPRLRKHVESQNKRLEFVIIKETGMQHERLVEVEATALGLKARATGRKREEAEKNSAELLYTRLNLPTDHIVSPLRSGMKWTLNDSESAGTVAQSLMQQLPWEDLRDSNVLSLIGSFTMNFCLDMLFSQDLTVYCDGKANQMSKTRASVTRDDFLGPIASDLLNGTLVIISQRVPGIDIEDDRILADAARMLLGGIFLYSIQKEAVNPFLTITDMFKERILEPFKGMLIAVSREPMIEMIIALEQYTANGYVNYQLPIKVLDKVMSSLQPFDNLEPKIIKELKQLKIFLEQYRNGEMIQGIIGINDSFEALVDGQAIQEFRLRAKQPSGETI